MSLPKSMEARLALRRLHAWTYVAAATRPGTFCTVSVVLLVVFLVLFVGFQE